MRDEEHRALSDIGAKLEELRAKWRGLSHGQEEGLDAPGEVATAVNDQRHHESSGLLNELEALEDERDRLHSQLMGEQAVDMKLLEDLAERVERLRRDFMAQLP